jgi:molybdate transport system substrate-binding protein
MIRAAALAAAVGLWMSAQAAPPLTVSAAASLTEVMEAAGRAYQESGGGPVRFNFGGSNVLARQIASGAPVDLFISADESQMDFAAAAHTIDTGSRIDLLGNRLAVIALPQRGVFADARALLDPGIRRIAIGDPAAVPAGVYARRYLESAGLWEALQPKLIPVANVRAALAAVDNGSADAAFAYVTDAAAAKAAQVALVISDPRAPRVVYPAAIVSASRNRAEAARFLAFLRGAAAAAIFSRHGFVPLATPR